MTQLGVVGFLGSVMMLLLATLESVEERDKVTVSRRATTWCKLQSPAVRVYIRITDTRGSTERQISSGLRGVSRGNRKGKGRRGVLRKQHSIPDDRRAQIDTNDL